MTMFYVATLSSYVLVEAENEEQARELGTPALQELRAECFASIVADLVGRGKNYEIAIRTVRPATDDEIELMRFHEEQVALERARSQTNKQ